ncbi:sugar ABC transporter permease [Paenibacillus sp. PAMC21692]|uniref:ABC transporter permease n=1 Tax=Paenibacillus sp. PAMC21692 TaxID=2762320 RepID=UPI00164DE44A|nr:sugar ABC transporter permease [Paenibacillus sp. PAMC21692]
MNANAAKSNNKVPDRLKKGVRRATFRGVIKNRSLYIMLIPVVLYFIVFHYKPMYGAIIAFKDFKPFLGIGDSPWVGFKHFQQFFESYFFVRILRNTIVISLYQLIFGFPAAIILALLLNELKNQIFKRFVQSISYLPHFISLVVVCGMLIDFLQPDGIINRSLLAIGVIGEPINFMILPEWFRLIFVGSGIWQSVGWSSIIFLAALSGINPSLYEAAAVDGAGRWRQMLSITLPGIMPTIIILLIINIGNFMVVGFDKIILLYNSATYETADVIGSFVFRRGITEANYSFTAAVGLFNSVINFTLLVLVNQLAKKKAESSLW